MSVYKYIPVCTVYRPVHTMYWSVYTCMYLPLVQFILGGRHEELEKGYQPPGVARKQLVPQTLLHLLLVFDTANKLVVLV